MVKGLVDKRENRSNIDYMNIGIEAELEYAFLEIGDIVFPELQLCIENKTCGDLFGSVIDKDRRLYGQFEKMKQYEHRYLFVRMNDYTLMDLTRRKAVETVITKAEILYGIHVRKIYPLDYEFNEAQTYAYVINKMLPMFEKQDFNTDLIKIPDKKVTKNGKLFKLASVVMNADGVGEVTALNIIEKYNSIEKLVGASIEDLMQIEKVTERKAKNIYELLH